MRRKTETVMGITVETGVPLPKKEPAKRSDPDFWPAFFSKIKYRASFTTSARSARKIEAAVKREDYAVNTEVIGRNRVRVWKVARDA